MPLLLADGGDSPQLPEPIKVRWSGDCRIKYEKRTLETLRNDGVTGVDAAARANDRQKTQVVIRTEKELAGTLNCLSRHIDAADPEGSSWGTRQKRDVAVRVRGEILDAAAERDVDPDAIVDDHIPEPERR